MEVSYRGFWSRELQRMYNIPKGFMITKIDQNYSHKAGMAFNEMDKKQVEKGEMIPIRFKADIIYTSRTLDQNALMWALYTVLADFMNGGMKGEKSEMITPNQLHLQDILEWCEIKTMILSNDMTIILDQTDLHIVEDGINKVSDNYIEIRYYKSTRFFDTKEMNDWIDRLFNRLAQIGVPMNKSSDILTYWQEWRSSMDKAGIFINSECSSIDEYRGKNNICEATGRYDEHGHIAHIKSRGSGGSDEPSNLLYLSEEVHLYVQHQKGWNEFLKLYPHLKNKVKTALKGGENG